MVNALRRLGVEPEGSYTTSLFNDGLNRMAQRVGEEVLTSKGLRIEDIARELEVRHKPSWHKH